MPSSCVYTRELKGSSFYPWLWSIYPYLMFVNQRWCILSTFNKWELIKHICSESSDSFNKHEMCCQTVHFHLMPPTQMHTRRVAARLENAKRRRGGVICLLVTGVHSATAVASLMGFNPTWHHHHNGTVRLFRWETSHKSVLINMHRCGCITACTHTHTYATIISDLWTVLNRTYYIFVPVPLCPYVVHELSAINTPKHPTP